MNKKSNYSIGYITLTDTSVAVDESVLKRLRLQNPSRPRNINCTFDLLYSVVGDCMGKLVLRNIMRTIIDIIDEM
jgi:hypothetical protein